MPPSHALHHRLRRLIGERFVYAGDSWVLIEVLADDDSIVLRRCGGEAEPSVQADAFGMPHRRVSDTLTLPISDSDHDGYAQDLLLLLEGRQQSSGR